MVCAAGAVRRDGGGVPTRRRGGDADGCCRGGPRGGCGTPPLPRRPKHTMCQHVTDTAPCTPSSLFTPHTPLSILYCRFSRLMRRRHEPCVASGSSAAIDPTSPLLCHAVAVPPTNTTNTHTHSHTPHPPCTLPHCAPDTHTRPDPRREDLSEGSVFAGVSIKHDVSVPLQSISLFLEQAAAAVQVRHHTCHHSQIHKYYNYYYYCCCNYFLLTC